MRRSSPRFIGLAALGLTTVALGVAACGGDDDDTGGGPPPPPGAVRVVAESVSGFDRDAYDADAGDVTFVFENDDSIAHTVVIDGVDEDEFKLTDDGDTGAVDLAPGDYELYCDVPGHRASGMEATLTVS